MAASDRTVSFYPRAEWRNRFCARCYWHLEFVKHGLARCVMSSVRQVADRFDELKQHGFEDRQARVLAIAIDEIVEDRHAGFLARIDARFDNFEAKIGARKFEIAALVITSSAALIGIGIAAYEYVIKPLLGSP